MSGFLDLVRFHLYLWIGLDIVGCLDGWFSREDCGFFDAGAAKMLNKMFVCLLLATEQAIAHRF